MKKKINKGGAPTKYKEEYCELLVKHMAQGLSFETFGPAMGVGRATIYKWLDKHKEFRDAKKEAEGFCRYFWERTGIDGVKGELKNFNAATWIYNMKCRFPDTWLEKRESDVQKIQTVRIELPEQQAQQIISMEPRTIEAGDGSME